MKFLLVCFVLFLSCAGCTKKADAQAKCMCPNCKCTPDSHCGCIGGECKCGSDCKCSG